MEIKINQIKIGERIRKEAKNIESLAASIERDGQLQPIGIDSNYHLLFGERRIKAFEQLGKDTIRAEIHSELSTAITALSAEAAENSEREPFCPTEAVEAAKRLEELEKAAAQKRKKAGTNQHTEPSDKLSEGSTGRVREKLGKSVGMSGVTYQKAKDVIEAAKESPEEFGSLPEKMDSTSVDAAHKELTSKKNKKKRLKKIAEISAGNEELSVPEKYPVIYADPPWKYEHVKTESRAIENQYPTMELQDICDLKVPAADDAILFLWVTSPKLEEGLKVLNAWGFKYKTCAVWDKKKMGMGYYFRQRHELLLVGTKGKIPAPDPANRPVSVLSYKRGEHSEKPEEFAHIIEDMYPSLQKIELFCRNQRKGWAVWGNQSSG